MPTLTERIESDYKQALKAGQRLRVDTLRLLKAGMQRVASDKRKDALEDSEVLQVLSQQAKQRRETLESAKQAGRQDVAAQATQELEILGGYMPSQLSDEAILKWIEEAIASVGKQQGQIMKHVMAKTAGAADGKRVSQLVTQRLQG
jgi:uncharacterized protein YqeY